MEEDYCWKIPWYSAAEDATLYRIEGSIYGWPMDSVAESGLSPYVSLDFVTYPIMHVHGNAGGKFGWYNVVLTIPQWLSDCCWLMNYTPELWLKNFFMEKEK